MYNIDKDISLMTLNEINELSNKSYNLCARNELHNLKDIKLFYERNGSFLHLENCGGIINNELIKLCERYFYHNRTVLKIPLLFSSKYDMLLPEQKKRLQRIVFLAFSKLPRRLYNGIMRVTHNNLSPENIMLVICYEGFDFKKIQNIGERSAIGLMKFRADILECLEDLLDEEVIGICEYHDQGIDNLVYADFDDSPENVKKLFSENKVTTVISKFEALSPLQENILNKHIQYCFSKVSVRTKNAMSRVMDLNNDESVMKKIFVDNIDLRAFRNVGEKSLKEFVTLKNELQTFLNFIVNTDEEQLPFVYSKLILKTLVDNLSIEIQAEFDGLFTPIGKIKLFSFINLLIKNRVLIGEQEETAFYKLFTHTGKPESSENLSVQKEKSRERHRQIEELLRKKMETNFIFIRNVLMEDIIDYGLDITENLLIIDYDLAKSINENEETDFNRFFCEIIFKIHFFKTHTLIVRDKRNSIGKSRVPRKILNHSFLISSELTKLFNFGRLIDDISLKTNEKIRLTYTIPSKTYLSQFVVDQEVENWLMDEIEITCKRILKIEFNFEVDSNNDLVFKRTTKIPYSQHCFDVLQDFGMPMKIAEMEKEILKKYPALQFVEGSLSGCMISLKGVFIYVGENTYGLKKWETEKENIKGGSIRGIIKEYLRNEKQPKHINDITTYVKQFRINTNAKSIYASLRLDTSKPFVFFEASYIGLKGKRYNKQLFRSRLS